MRSSQSLPLRTQFRQVLAVVWEMLKRRPILAFWPLMIYLRFFEKDLVNQWAEEAEQAMKERAS